ncbi:MAG TPA: hypothetical protein VL201_00965, partial [Patescibacteria group bacterium]|nr:hypothetical protein [Patescibacteria group bacterium]
MLNTKIIITIALLFSGYIQAGEYSIIPEQIQVISLCKNLFEQKYNKHISTINACRKSLLSPTQIMLVMNWLNTNHSINKKLPSEIFIKIFTYVNSNVDTNINTNQFTFAGYLSQESVDLIKDRRIQFSDFTVKRNAENSFILDVCPTKPIHDQDLNDNKVNAIISILQQNNFLPTTITYSKAAICEHIVKNQSDEIVQFSIKFYQYNTEFLAHSHATMSLLPREIYFYLAFPSVTGSRTRYPKKIDNLEFSDVVKSYYKRDNLIIVELMDEQVEDYSDYDPERHNPKCARAT